jgi:hypothetical protein
LKKIILISITAFLFSSCEEECDCDYVVYDRNPPAGWVETYRSTWDTTCEDELLDESQFTFNGYTSYSKTLIECD